MWAPSSLASSQLSRLGARDLRGAAAVAPAAPAPQQLRLGCSRRRAQRVVAMAGSGKFFVGGNWKCVSARSASSALHAWGISLLDDSFVLKNHCSFVYPASSLWELALLFLNGTKDFVSKLVSELNAATLEPDVDVVVAPPFIYIDQVKNSLTDRIEVSAQNVWVGKGGAYTGEISAEQLVDIGCKWVILGHSERRNIIGETDEFIAKKAAYALSQNVKVIACIGELLEEREAGKTFEVCFKQMKAYADSITNWADVVIAYEPVWAIGTGKVASPEQAQEVHAAVRDWLKTNVSPEVASSVRIIYGGSVNAGNCADLAKKEDIDGFLVGGASLKGPDFTTIINSVTSKKVAA
ncbi:hypothetical protein EJB05_43685 [Eragrostis curvula]|uniref:Triosephosphate isomerase n=1 Tax=Eragrostis curvula TaxID=38414 RepID=A0A5J9TFW8_9POAL|nr:hypothetical protein EJB05_43685 [Eragrostis curvula]